MSKSRHNPLEAAQRMPAASGGAAARPTAAQVRSNRGGPLPRRHSRPRPARGGSRPRLQGAAAPYAPATRRTGTGRTDRAAPAGARRRAPAFWRARCLARCAFARCAFAHFCAPSGVTPWLCSPRERAAEAAGSSPKNRPRCVLQDWLCVTPASARARGRCSPLARCTQKFADFANKLLAVLCT